jgi:SAM-dependent methyltransferase
LTEFWNEDLPPGYYDKILLEGLERKRGIQSNWHNVTFLEVANYFANKIKHLDYACGPGTLIGSYSICKSTGVDISDLQIKFAKNKYGKKNKFLTLKEFEENDEDYFDFDLITIIGLFEFIKDDEILRVLDMLYKKLTPDGKVIITTPNYESNMKYLEKVVNIFGAVGYENQHVNRFNKQRLIKLISNSRFNVIEIKSILNFGIFFSLFSIQLGKYLNTFVKKHIFKKNGYLLFAILEK